MATRLIVVWQGMQEETGTTVSIWEHYKILAAFIGGIGDYRILPHNLGFPYLGQGYVQRIP